MSSGIHTLSRSKRALFAVAAITALVFGSALSATSAQAASGPVNTVPPVIVGTPNVGQVLSVNSGSWDDATTFTYTWSDGTDNDLDNPLGGSLYQLTDADLGKTITATVTAAGSPDVSATSAGVVVLPNTVTVTTTPTITGDNIVGSTLTATPGAYTGTGVVVTYDWYFSHPEDPTYGGGHGGELNDTDTTYVVTDAEIGSDVGVFVTATASNGDSVTTDLLTPDVAIPAAPVATDAGLTSANQGGVTGSVTGSTATITLSTLPEGTEVFVYGYSTPTALGFFFVNASNQIVVPFGTLPAGQHKLLVINAATGAIVGWFGVAELASTGASVNPLEWYLAGGALVLGALLAGFGVYLRRRRSTI